MSKLISAGYENSINVDKVVAVADVGSNPVKRMIKNARDMGMLIDLTLGNKTRAVIVMDSGHVVLSINSPETFTRKFNK